MKKALIAVGALVGALVLVVVIGGMMLPDDKYIERSTTIDAPIETVFAQVNDFKNWEAWSAWAAMDPDMKVEYEAQTAGAGAGYSWDGPKAGQGSMTITESVPNETIKTAIDFGDMGRGSGHWTFAREGEAVKVNWGFTSHSDGKLMGKWFNTMLDGMVGPQFEEGLAKIKAIAESAPPPAKPDPMADANPCGGANPCGNPCGDANPCGNPCGDANPCGNPCGDANPCANPCGE